MFFCAFPTPSAPENWQITPSVLLLACDSTGADSDPSASRYATEVLPNDPAVVWLSTTVQPAGHVIAPVLPRVVTNPTNKFPTTMLAGRASVVLVPLYVVDSAPLLTWAIAIWIAYQAFGIVRWNAVMAVAIPFVSAVLVMFMSAPDVPIAPSSRKYVAEESRAPASATLP